MGKSWATWIATFCAIAATCAHANDDLDTSWNGTGTVLMPVSGESVGANAGVAQADGRILLAGGCLDASWIATICMSRLQPDGQRDDSFGPGETGVFTFSQFPDWPHGLMSRALVRQSDGRIIVAGISAGDEATDRTVYASVTRLTASGALDPSVQAQPVRFEFSHNDAMSSQSEITAAALQPDGKLVVAGPTNPAGSATRNYDFAVARLRTDLTLDPSFNGTGISVAPFDLGGGDLDAPFALAVQRDGKIVVAGAAATPSNGLDAAVLRLNADGTPDDTFGNQGRASFDFSSHLDDQINAIRIDGEGRIWLAGSSRTNGTDTDFLVARLRTNGTLDTDFCSSGYRQVYFDLDRDTSGVMEDDALGLLLQSDGKIVLAGRASNGEAGGDGFDFAAVRLLPNCQVDNTFGSGGTLHGRFGTQLFSYATEASFGGSGIVLTGYAGSTFNTSDVPPRDPIDGQFGVAMIHLDLIFKNGFEP